MIEDFVPKRLSKKALLQFLDEYEASLWSPMAGTEEERTQGFKDEWATRNEEWKKAGLKKSKRKNKKSMLKQKWGIGGKGYKSRIKEARLSLIGSIKKTFDL